MQRDPIKMSDMELIDWLRNDALNNVPIGELTRRNTEELKKFNKMSTLLSIAMISIAVISTIIMVISLFKRGL